MKTAKPTKKKPGKKMKLATSSVKKSSAAVKTKAKTKLTTIKVKTHPEMAEFYLPNIYSSDLLTPDEERALLTNFWENKKELVRQLLKHYSKQLKQFRPPMEPWPMAQFIREHTTSEVRRHGEHSPCV